MSVRSKPTDKRWPIGSRHQQPSKYSVHLTRNQDIKSAWVACPSRSQRFQYQP
jgi:hypothetical protein